MSVLSLVYQDIKVQLLDRIGGVWPEGTRLPPTQELARELDAGQRNTLRAVQELVREGYLQSRPGRGTFVARRLPEQGEVRSTFTAAEKRTRVLILMTPGPDPFLTEIAEAFATELMGHDADIAYQWRSKGIDLRDKPFDAFLVINPDERRIRFGPQQKVVVVSTINTVNVDASEGYDVVSVEEEQGGFMAGRLLRQVGCESAGFIGVRHRDTPLQTDRTSAVRLRGFESGWNAAVDGANLFWATSYCMTSVVKAVAHFASMPNRPEAIFAASDDLAVGFALAGLSHDLLPGRDYQLIGFDGQHRGRTLAECPPITSIAIPSADMGRRAAQLLLQRIETPAKAIERVLLGCSLFRGRTVGNYPEETPI